MRAALGDRGAQWIADRHRDSTLGFLSQGILTAPRVYYAMARDGLFFQSVGKLSARTGAPVVAIVLQGIAATAIALCGKYEQILNYEVSVDFISFALTAAALFVFRRQRSRRARGRHLSRARASLYNRIVRARLRLHRRHYGVDVPVEYGDRPGDSAHRHSRIFVLEPPRPIDLMRQKHSDYMHWAKTQSSARFNLATSGVGPFPLRELPFDFAPPANQRRQQLRLPSAEKCHRAKHGVDPDCIVEADGTAMANYLAMAAGGPRR